MSDEPNTLGWPETLQLPREVAARINRFFNVADAAATLIQRAHRGVRPDGASDFRGGKRFRLHEWLLGSTVTTTQKYDGTNVGVLTDGTLLGRRLVIEATANSYQKCDLKNLRSLKTGDALNELIALGAATPMRAALYGELLCNNLYSYNADGLVKSWIAFGALLEFGDEAAAASAAVNLRAAGQVCSADESIVRVCASAAFVEVMQRHGLPAVATTPHATLSATVQSMREWMMGEHGEGLVLSCVRKSDKKTSTFKWKISREHQPGAIDELTELVAALKTGADGKAQLVDEAIHELVRTLLAVATHVDSTTGKAGAAKEAKTKAPKPGKAALVDAAALDHAIKSALTKFDAIEATFEARGQAGVATLSEQLVAEVTADKELSLPAEADKQARDMAVKEVAMAVKKYLGMQFGLWKKGKAEAVVVT